MRTIDRKFDRSFFARFKSYSFESFQFANRTCYRSGYVVDVKLDNFVTGDPASIGYIYAHLHGLVGAHLQLVEPQILELKSRIAEAVSERVKRRIGDVEIFRSVLICRKHRAAGTFVVVVKRELPDGPRKRNGQLAAWISIAEQRIDDRVAGLGPGKPGFQNCGRILSQPIDRQRTAIYQDHRVGFAGGVDSFYQIELLTGQPDV